MLVVVDVFAESRLGFVGSVDATGAIGRVRDDGVDGSGREVPQDVEGFPCVDESGGGVWGGQDAGELGLSRGLHGPRIVELFKLST